MIFVMTSLPLVRVFQCLFTFTLVSASRWLAGIWQLSQQRATRELEVEFKFQRGVHCSCKLSFLFLPGELACRLQLVVASSLNTVLYPNLTAMHLVQQANSSPVWWEKQGWLVQKFVAATLRQSLLFFLVTQKKKKTALLTGWQAYTW